MWSVGELFGFFLALDGVFIDVGGLAVIGGLLYFDLAIGA